MKDYPITKFVGDKKNPKWELVEAFNRDGITVPEGFVYDKASVPRFLWWLLPPFGTYERAAVIHDWIYRNKGLIDEYDDSYTRSDADKLFFKHMLEDGVSKRRAKIMYNAVHLLGWTKWDKK